MRNKKKTIGNKQLAKTGTGNFKETKVYKPAFGQAMEILEVSRSFPREEIDSLTDQIGRSSRRICANIGEAYRKKCIRLISS